MGDSRVKVTIAVVLDPAWAEVETLIFETEGSTDGDTYDLAEGLLSGAEAQAERALRDRGRLARDQ